MNLRGTYTAAHSDDFRKRVIAALVLTAQDILNDPSKEGRVEWHSAREIMRVPESHAWLEQFMWKISANSAIAGTADDQGNVNASDDDIRYVVNAEAWPFIFPEPAPPTQA